MRPSLLVLLAACAPKPIDIVAQIEIIPAKPGDDVDLYFGTVPRPGQLSETVPGVMIDQVQAYAVDKIGPHTVKDVSADQKVDISEPLPTLNMVIAVEDGARYAAAAAIDLSADPPPGYVLRLEPVDASSGLDAAAWGPLDQPEKECAYYNGPAANATVLAAAIVVDTDTATTGTPYVDLDCDGWTESSGLECKPDIYDSTVQASDDSTCVAAYEAEDDCLVVGQPCADGTMTPNGCPQTITPENLTKWCVPTGYCESQTPRYASLADIVASPSSTYGAIACDVQVTGTGQPCVQTITATAPTDLALCAGGAPTIDIAIGVAGPPYALVATIPSSAATVSAAQQSGTCSIQIVPGGDWSQLIGNPAIASTLMLALTPHGAHRGVVLPIAFTTQVTGVEGCVSSLSECTVTVPTSTSDSGLTTCLTP